MKKATVLLSLLAFVVILTAGCGGDDIYYTDPDPELGTLNLQLNFPADVAWVEITQEWSYIDITRECGSCIPFPVDFSWDESIHAVVGSIQRPAGYYLLDYWFEYSDGYASPGWDGIAIQIKAGETANVSLDLDFETFDEEGLAYSAQAHAHASDPTDP